MDTPNTRTGLGTAGAVLAAFDELRAIEWEDDDELGPFLSRLGQKDPDDAELALLRDLADLVRPYLYRVDTDEVAALYDVAEDHEASMLDDLLKRAGLRWDCRSCDGWTGPVLRQRRQRRDRGVRSLRGVRRGPDQRPDRRQDPPPARRRPGRRAHHGPPGPVRRRSIVNDPQPYTYSRNANSTGPYTSTLVLRIPIEHGGGDFVGQPGADDVKNQILDNLGDDWWTDDEGAPWYIPDTGHTVTAAWDPVNASGDRTGYTLAGVIEQLGKLRELRESDDILALQEWLDPEKAELRVQAEHTRREDLLRDLADLVIGARP